MADEEWSSRFGEIVFGKFATFPYWPCCIVDPTRLNEKKDVINKGLKVAGKQYTVLFYGETSVGYINLDRIKPYNEETKADMLKQNLKKTEADFLKAIQDADYEMLLPVKDRCKYRLAPADSDNSIVTPAVSGVDCVVSSCACYLQLSSPSTPLLTPFYPPTLSIL
ncbi:hypothetical protein EON65_27705 [archaeon]|nr:MAG: hypothetical protein EON65_27705 [archaeon]